MTIADRTGGDPDVVRLFAIFHDSQRRNDHDDPGHGARAADFARSLRGKVFAASDAPMDNLDHACRKHSAGELSDDPTIGACWDAARLDLARPGISITPNTSFLSTAVAHEIASHGSVESYLQTQRHPHLARVEEGRGSHHPVIDHPVALRHPPGPPEPDPILDHPAGCVPTTIGAVYQTVWLHSYVRRVGRTHPYAHGPFTVSSPSHRMTASSPSLRQAASHSLRDSASCSSQ